MRTVNFVLLFSKISLLKTIIYIFLTGLLFFTLPVVSQTKTISSQKLDTVFISSSRILSTSQKLPFSVSVFKAEESDAIRQQKSLQEYVQGVPGLFTQNANNFAQDLRISIRGFGARSAFGIRGVKLIVDGIPETTPDGQGQLDNLNLGIIDRIEVIKGPSSSLYGNASGGVVSISTLSDFDKNFSKWKAAVGAFGFQNYQATAGIQAGNASYVLHGNYARSNGYRDQSGFEQINTNFSGRFQVSDRLVIKALLNYSDSPEAEDPGSLTMEDVEENRRQARDRNVLFDTGESIQQFKIGTSLEWEHSPHTNIEGYLFYTNRGFDGKLPFEFGGIIDLSRNFLGQGASITYKKNKNTLRAGYDFGYQDDDRQRFRNLEGVQGDQTLNQKERFTNIGIYVTDHWEIGKWYLTGGIRFDYNKLAAEDAFLSNGDDSGDLTLNAVNPSVGVSYAFAKAHTIYSNFSTGFETPTLSELSADPNGGQGFNENLEAQRATNYEIGFKGSFINKLRYQIAFFRIDTQDDLVPFELEAFPDRTFFRNAGKTNRNGIEVEGVYAFSELWNITASYAFSDFKYRNFTTPSGAFDGKALPGIPKHVANIGVRYGTDDGFYASLNTSIVGMQYANDSNDAEVNGYELLHVRTGYLFKYRKAELRPYIGVNNLLDQEYTDNVRINAFGNRFFEPAPGIAVYGGLTVQF